MRRIQSGKKVNMRKRGKERERERKRDITNAVPTFCNDSCHANCNDREAKKTQTS